MVPDIRILVPSIFGEQVRTHPHNLAAVDGKHRRTYLRLSQEVSALQAFLNDIQPGDRVGVHMRRRGAMAVALLAILNKGAVYVPLNREYPSERLRYIIDDADIRKIITDDRTVGSDFSVDVITPDEWQAETKAAVAEFDPKVISPTSPAYFIYTSGTTGLPKGVVISHGGLTNILQYSRHHFGFTAADSVLALTSFSFDFSVLELLLPLVSGGTLHFVDDIVTRDPQALTAALIDRRATFLMGTPSMFSSLKAAGWQVPQGLNIVAGGEELRAETVSQLADAESIWNIYGPTETSIYCMSERIGGSQDITIGTEVPNTEVVFMNGLDRVEDGEIGEICIRGVGVALGYHKKPELTAARFIADPQHGTLYRTGDLGRRRLDGRIDYLGRTDDQVKIRGFRVELGQIETALRQHPKIRDAAVVVRRNDANTLLVAYVVLSDAAQEQDIKHDLLGRLLAHEVPHRIVAISEFPLSFNGKVDRKALSTIALPPAGTASPSDSEGNDSIVQRLKDAWISVLGVKSIGLNDNFFDVGGDSLSALRIVGKAHELGLKVSAADIVRSGTIASLARLVNDVPMPASESERLPDTRLRLLPAQIRFFERSIPFKTHFCEPLAYKILVPLKRHVLAASLTKLVERHPVLASRFNRKGDEWTVQQAAADVSFPLAWRELKDMPMGEREEIFRAELERMHYAMDYEAGPICSASYFSSRGGTDDVVLFLFHHLICDGVALHNLIEDFVLTYESLEDDDNLSLPPPPPPPGSAYAARLETFANSASTEMQGEEWLALPWRDVSKLPCDDPKGSVAPEHIKSFTITSDGDYVNALRTISRSSVVETEEVFLAALADGMASAIGSPTISIDVTANGRQPPFFCAGALRTVGWLALVAPYVISVPTSASGLARLCAIRQQVRHLRTISYAWPALRYMHADPRIRTRLASLPEPQLYLNYRGPMQEISLSGRFSSYDIQGRPYSASRPHGYSYPVELRVDLRRDQMIWRWSYSSAMFKQNQIPLLAERARISLEEFVAISPKTHW